ncbi:radical SAM protein, partial [Streptomyces sp. NPDC086835]|uniref:radical SAM protein n=1 Tax=Streptomyces sp. NPDC086835 TaxID=3365761 RepID=UPI00381F09B9
MRAHCNCQLKCTHCCTLSGPKVSHGSMTVTDWQAVVADIAQLGIPGVQFIGGEPTRSVDLLPLIAYALCRGLEVEVYSNLTHVRPTMWQAFQEDGARLATSYHSDRPDEHEAITGGRGSHQRTRRRLVDALTHARTKCGHDTEPVAGRPARSVACCLLLDGMMRLRKNLLNRSSEIGRP